MPKAVWISFIVIVTAFLLLTVSLPRILEPSDPYGSVISQISTFKGLLDRFHLDCDRYPTTAEGLAALHDQPYNLKGKWAGP